ncbi:MAG: MBL fold metallo-hydrolase [Lentisphaeria bacterium]|nr:MBL fold metallo-hydrolase [Lentisphaeria bacterium]
MLKKVLYLLGVLLMITMQSYGNEDKNFLPILREKAIFVFDKMPDCWNNPEVFTVPKFTEVNRKDMPFEYPAHIKVGYLDSMPYQGKPTKVFAVYGFPEKKLNNNEKFPAVVLVHGGGGTAYTHWVDHWTKRGYAAIAVDTMAGKPLKSFEGADSRAANDVEPGPSDFFADNLPLEDRWPFHGAAAIIKAHSFISSLPEVDKNRTAMAGISWGAVLGGIAAGVDQRFKAVSLVYGCGYVDDATFIADQYLRPLGFWKALGWLEPWDPALYLKKTATPIQFVSDPQDAAFWPRSWQRTTISPKGEVYRTLRNGLGHSHTAGMTVETEEFIDSMLGCIPEAIPQVTNLEIKDRKLTIQWKNINADAVLELVYTDGDWSKKAQKWLNKTITKNYRGEEITFDIPENAKCCYVNIITDKGRNYSSSYRLMPIKLQFIGTGAADYDWSKYGEKGILGSATTLIDDHILIDCGTTAAAALKRFKADYPKITDIVITHNHSDHCEIENIRKVAAGRKINLYASPQVCEKMKDICTVHPLKPGDKFTIGEYTFTTLIGNHVLVDPNEFAFNYLIHGKGKNILYALDTSWLSSHAHKLIGNTYLNAIIWDATMSEPGDWRIFDHCDTYMIRIMREAFEQAQTIDAETINWFNHRARTLWPTSIAAQEKIADREKAKLCHEGEIFYLQ